MHRDTFKYFDYFMIIFSVAQFEFPDCIMWLWIYILSVVILKLATVIELLKAYDKRVFVYQGGIFISN